MRTLVRERFVFLQRPWPGTTSHDDKIKNNNWNVAYFGRIPAFAAVRSWLRHTTPIPAKAGDVYGMHK